MATTGLYYALKPFIVFMALASLSGGIVGVDPSSNLINSLLIRHAWAISGTGDWIGFYQSIYDTLSY